jgi:hypothetical protein
MFKSLARDRERKSKTPKKAGHLSRPFHFGECSVGELIMMPVRNASQELPGTPADASSGDAPVLGIDFAMWKNAPKERTPGYFPTYSAVSKAIQTAMRGWVREWFTANPEILQRPHTAYSVLVYQCTTPFSGRPTNMFTYDIQQTVALNKAFASAAAKLGRELKTLDTKSFGWFTREHYFAYRSKEVIKYVSKNRRTLYKMLNVETVLMDSILKFAVIDIPKFGLAEATVLLRRAFKTQLHRFSDEFDLSTRTDELLKIATDALISKLAADSQLQAALAA